MEILSIALVALYFFVGVWHSHKWFGEEYEKEYEETVGNTESHERGMVGILLLLMTVFWPFIFFYKLIKALYGD